VLGVVKRARMHDLLIFNEMGASPSRTLGSDRQYARMKVLVRRLRIKVLTRVPFSRFLVIYVRPEFMQRL
jgi:hypothetical protein